jgi:arylsulfatase A-like enzyme/Flp pilus assembly protein TadD
MKKWRGLILFIFAAVMAPSASLLSAVPTRTNLLLITIDTLRPDRLGCYGSKYLQTPTIDRWAKSGVVFFRAFAHTPTTLPSHTNILLGTTPLYHGVHDNGFLKVPEDPATLATVLRQSGYATGAFVGAFPLDSRFGLNRGFDVYDDNYGTGAAFEYKFVERKAESVVDASLAWLKGQTGPWFLWVHCFDPHQPYEPPEPYLTRFKDDLYSGEVAYVDSALAKLAGYLDDSGLAKATAIVLTGDHGQSLGEHGETTHGYFAYNATLWVPLIISAPGLGPARVDQNAGHIDIFPTVCDLLGVPKPAVLQGVSLLPAAQGKRLAPRPIYFESLYPYYRRGWAPLRGFIDGDKKFIDSPIPEVYDLKADFGEAKNIAGKDLSLERATLARLMSDEAGTAGRSRPRLDTATERKLQSLGYIGGFQPPTKTRFEPADDLKTLLPFNRMFEDAVDLNSRGETNKSIALLRRLILERADFDNPYLYLVTVLQTQRRFDEAVAVLKKGYDDNPRNYKIMIEYGISLADVGRNDEALIVLNKASVLIDWDPELWNYLGVAYFNKGDLEKALASYNRALSLDPKYAIVLTNLGVVHVTMATKDKDSAALRRAVDYFKKAIESDPNYASAYNGLGSAYRMAENLDAAIFCWTKAVELDPGHQFALYNLGVSLLDKGDKAQALRYLTKYKQLYYNMLSPKDKESLDAAIEKCR